MKINPLLKKLKGYQRAPKERFRLFTSSHRLTPQEFILYEFAIAITDWDRKHTTYGTFNGSNKNIADVLGWKSDVTVLRLKKSLIKKRLFIPTADEDLRVNGFDKWELRKAAKNQLVPENNQDDSDKNQETPEKNKDDYSQNDKQSLVSYKGNIGSYEGYESPHDEGLSDEEFSKIMDILDTPSQTAAFSKNFTDAEKELS